MEEKTDYDWYMLRTELRRSDLRYPLLKKIGEVIGLDLPTEKLNPLQLFAKKFEPERSFCAPHIEDHKIYGDWTYMLYRKGLTAEDILLSPDSRLGTHETRFGRC